MRYMIALPVAMMITLAVFAAINFGSIASVSGL